MKLAYGANGDQADAVFDSENGLDGGFEGSVTPGHARTAKLGFAVPKGRQAMDVEVQPGFLTTNRSTSRARSSSQRMLWRRADWR